MQSTKWSILQSIKKRGDLILAALLIAIVFMMILPLPTFLVDILIATNMSMAVVLLMLALYITSPLDLTVFPSILLLTTLFRLSLSITTTRLILLEADAGQIIYTFGNFVVGGNLIVGLVIFLIITIVQFMVITKGSERVAEVGARFSLDGMPGKQMSIDGDMRAGVIDVEEAGKRRSLVEKESQLYGAMDGAMKFVKGDAIAGIIIIVVNIIGGVSIGVAQNGLSTGEALQLYSILTIGDGLVSQIPALFISITAGIIVTRVTTTESEDLSNDIGRQIAAQPRALLIGGTILLLFAVIPGFPSFTFLGLACIIGGSGVLLLVAEKRKRSQSKSNIGFSVSSGGGAPAIGGKLKKGAGAAPALPNADNLSGDQLGNQEEFALTVPLLIDLDAALQSQLDAEGLNHELVQIRRALYLDLGVPFPGIHLRFNENLESGTYIIQLQEVPVARGHIQMEKLLVTETAEQLDILGISYEVGEPFLPKVDTLWVSNAQKEALEQTALHYMTPNRILTYHLSHVLKEYSEDFIGIQETRYLLEEMEGRFSDLVKEVQRIVPLQKITEILQRLVSEDISVRNLRAILEALVEWGQKEKDVVQLTEYVRSNLKRYICYKYSSGQNVLPAYLLDQEVEEAIRNGIRQTSAGSYLALDPVMTQKISDHTKQVVGDISKLSSRPVLVVSMDIRRYVRKMIEADLYELPVLSFQELTQQINIQPLGRVAL